MRRLCRAGLLVAALVGLGAAHRAKPPPTPSQQDAAAQLRAAEQQRAAGLAAQQQAAAAAAAAQREEDALAAQRVAAAARLRAAEDATDAAATRMADLAAQRRDAQQRLAEQSANLGPLLPLIERMALYPAETLLAIPSPPDQTLAGITVLQGMAHEMEREAEALRRRQDEVARLAAAMQAQTPALEAAQHAQAQQAAALDVQIAQASATRSAAEEQAQQAARAAANAASRAESLRDVIAAIEAARAQAEQQARAEALADAKAKRLSAARDARSRVAALAVPAGPGLTGASLAPVAGAVIRRFGAATDAGPATGISFQPPPAARVVSPCGGKVEFAAPFRSYGKLLIINCGGGYHFVLAGLDRLDAQAGGAVRAGEPVGAMPDWNPRAAGGRPALYVELRRVGVAIDPAPFLRARL